MVLARPKSGARIPPGSGLDTAYGSTRVAMVRREPAGWAIHSLRGRNPSMAEDPLGIREGEIAVELPQNFDASLYFIGRIRTPWTRREECPRIRRGLHHPRR